jgi:hypothetical protein
MDQRGVKITDRHKNDYPQYEVSAPNAMPDLNGGKVEEWANENNVNNIHEEMAADFAVSSPVSYVPREQSIEEAAATVEAGGTALGWVALVFAAASWFLWPVVLGITSAVLGFIAYRQGAKALGSWAMALGLIAVLLSLVIVPFYYAVT